MYRVVLIIYKTGAATLGMVDVPTVEESTLRYATSTVQGGVQYKRARVQQGAPEDEAIEQAGNWAFSVIMQSGADLVETYTLLREQEALAGLLADELATALGEESDHHAPAQEE